MTGQPADPFAEYGQFGDSPLGGNPQGEGGQTPPPAGHPGYGQNPYGQNPYGQGYGQNPYNNPYARNPYNPYYPNVPPQPAAPPAEEEVKVKKQPVIKPEFKDKIFYIASFVLLALCTIISLINGL